MVATVSSPNLAFVSLPPFDASKIRDPVPEITTIDCHYLDMPYMAASYLIVDRNAGSPTAAFIDNNTNNAVPHLLKELEKQGLSGDDVEYVIVTHVHMDHAGGTSELLRHCPKAQVLAHPRAAPHLVDPTDLIAGVKHVYGEKEFDSMYGQVTPIDRERITPMMDGDTVWLGARTLHFLHTRGHAKHHFVVHDTTSDSVFTGDSFGVSMLPFLRHYRAPSEDDQKVFGNSSDFLYPSCSPVDFEPDEAFKALDIILETGAERAYLTHFGVWENLNEGARQMKTYLAKYQEFQTAVKGTLELMPENLKENLRPDLEKWALDFFKGFFVEELKTRDRALLNNAVLAGLHFDMHLNAQGILIAAEKQLKAEHSAPADLS